MNKPITVNQLKKCCEEEIKKGNGENVIMISDDDEGNGYHYLWYSFLKAEEFINEFTTEEDLIDNRIASLKDTIILG